MLRAERLRHAFGRIRALDDVSFTLTAGESLTIFGPNGAGKTTLLRVLAGLVRPQEGRVHLEGGRRAVGWIGHAAHLYGHLTVRENVLFWASLYDVPPREREARAAAVLARLALTARADQPVRTLSRGLLQRAAIARALVHDPRVLLLDEPFTGLDPGRRRRLRGALSRLAGAGTRLVIAVHHRGDLPPEVNRRLHLRRGRAGRLPV